MEIIQPEHLIVPDRRDPQAWERAPIVYEEWARFVLPQFRFGEEAVNNFVLGHVLDMILYDDGNCFAAGVNGEGKEWYLEIAPDIQRQLITRLTWEIDSGVLPEDLFVRLSGLLDYVNSNDWICYANMSESRNIWRQIKVELEARISMGGDLEEVYGYFVRTDKLLRDFWVQFIEGK